MAIIWACAQTLKGRIFRSHWQHQTTVTLIPIIQCYSFFCWVKLHSMLFVFTANSMMPEEFETGDDLLNRLKALWGKDDSVSDVLNESRRSRLYCNAPLGNFTPPHNPSTKIVSYGGLPNCGYQVVTWHQWSNAISIPLIYNGSCVKCVFFTLGFSIKRQIHTCMF